MLKLKTSGRGFLKYATEQGNIYVTVDTNYPDTTHRVTEQWVKNNHKQLSNVVVKDGKITRAAVTKVVK